MRAWSFHLQIFYIGTAPPALEMFKDPRSAIIDRSISEDAYIFARALNRMGNLDERDYQTYRRVFDLVVRTLPTPSLLVYLKARLRSADRIHQRGRSIESGISADYLKLLDDLYEDWMENLTSARC